MSRDQAPPHPVSSALRRRVLRAVRAEPKTPAGSRRHWSAGPVAGLTAAVAMAFAAAIIVQLGAPGPSVRVARVVPAALGPAELRVGADYAELVIDRLPVLPPNQTYELWLQAGARRPAPSTLFGVTSRGTADIGVPRDPRGITRLLVTVEPAGGTRAPTAPPVIAAPFT